MHFLLQIQPDVLISSSTQQWSGSSRQSCGLSSPSTSRTLSLSPAPRGFSRLRSSRAFPLTQADCPQVPTSVMPFLRLPKFR